MNCKKKININMHGAIMHTHGVRGIILETSKNWHVNCAEQQHGAGG